jgi:hypothetical protein
MRTAERLRRVVNDRAQRYRLVHRDLPQGEMVGAWRDAGPAVAPSDSSMPAEELRAGSPVNIAVLLALALCFGAAVGPVGSGLLNEAMRAMGVAGETPDEMVQRKQATAITQLDLAVRALNAAMAGLSVHADLDGSREAVMKSRLAQVDADITALRTGMGELRAAQDAATDADAWRGPVAQVGAAVKAARSEIAGLRASIAELGQVRTADLGALRGRIDRIEQAMVEHELIGPMRGALRDGDPARTTAAREGTPGQGQGNIGQAPSMPMALR